MRCMLGHIGGCTTVFTTECQALQQAKDDQDDGRCSAPGGVIGQDANQEGRRAHNQNGDQEGVLASYHVAQAAKENCAEGAYDKSGGESEQCKNESRAFVQAAEKLFRNDGC